MYNRYVRNDNGKYERVSVEDNHSPPNTDHWDHHTHAPASSHSPPFIAPDRGSPLAGITGKGGLLSGILDKLKLSDIDTGDLLLLVILFLLFRDGEDDELLIALGLLLIL